jgi:cell division cycle 20-like protein 1 (cofactor of APC complex)
LASGGGEGSVCIWTLRRTASPEWRFTQHEAAVKALAWSPHRRGLLASGGGTSDKFIRTWNTLSGKEASCVNAGSQVCNMAWSESADEIVTSHGYCGNEIILWRHPGFSRIATLAGHDARVVFMTASPDGTTIVTGAGDESIRLWHIFDGPNSQVVTLPPNGVLGMKRRMSQGMLPPPIR